MNDDEVEYRLIVLLHKLNIVSYDVFLSASLKAHNRWSEAYPDDFAGSDY
jgi:hypothetical protein